MSKSIKLADDVYAHLGAVQAKGETYSDCVARLLRIYNTICEAALEVRYSDAVKPVLLDSPHAPPTQ